MEGAGRERRDEIEDGRGKEEWFPHVIDYGYYSALKSGSIDGTDKLPHDHAVVRAMNSSYTANKQVQGNSEKTLLVARLSHDTTEEVLRNAFSKYGAIENCRLIKDIVTGRSKGYGFVEYCHGRDCDRAYQTGTPVPVYFLVYWLDYGEEMRVAEAHSMFLDDSKIVVDYECERLLPGWTPRRFGGGLGGKKESGQLRFGGRDRPFRKPISLGSVHLRRHGDKAGRDHYSSSRRRNSGPYSRK